MGNGTHDSDLFGIVPNQMIAEIEIDQVLELKQSVLEITNSNPDVSKIGNGDSFTIAVENFRRGVGALWLRLNQEIDGDIEYAQNVSDSFWRCMWNSLFRRNLSPQKYYSICGKPREGFGACITYLCNIPGQEEFAIRWGKPQESVFGDRLWNTKNELMEKEKEYREISVVIIQIGIGVGGMLLGLIGLILSLILALVSTLVSVLANFC